MVAVVLLCIPSFMRKQISRRSMKVVSHPPCLPFKFNTSQLQTPPVFSEVADFKGLNDTHEVKDLMFKNYNCVEKNGTISCEPDGTIIKATRYHFNQHKIRVANLLMPEKTRLDQFYENALKRNKSINTSTIQNYFQQNCSNETERFLFVKPSGLGSNPYFVLYYYQIIFNFLTVGLPISLLIALNIPIIHAMRTSRRMMQQSSLMYRGTQEKNITIVMTIIILELLLCHIPDRILVVYRNSFPGDFSCPHPIFFLQFVFNLLILINSSSDFIIYYIFRSRLKFDTCDKHSM